MTTIKKSSPSLWIGYKERSAQCKSSQLWLSVICFAWERTSRRLSWIDHETRFDVCSARVLKINRRWQSLIRRSVVRSRARSGHNFCNFEPSQVLPEGLKPWQGFLISFTRSQELWAYESFFQVHRVEIYSAIPTFKSGLSSLSQSPSQLQSKVSLPEKQKTSYAQKMTDSSIRRILLRFNWTSEFQSPKTFLVNLTWRGCSVECPATQSSGASKKDS